MLDEIAAAIAPLMAGAEKPAEPPPRPPTLHEIALGIIKQPTPARIVTGVTTLDEASGGGLACPRLLVFGGAPGACKTSFAVAIAHHAARAGFPSAIFASDEGKEGVALRIAQREGLIAAQLRDGEGNDGVRRVAWELAAKKFADLPMMVDDGTEDYVTVEYMADWLAKGARGGPSVLVVDSIQTARTEERREDETVRARVDAMIRALKRIVKRHNVMVIAISEVGRAWYRSKSEQINPLAAFKESGGIEYAAETAMVFSHVDDDEHLFDIVMPKNRGYERRPFRLELDRQRMTFREVPLPDATGEDRWPKRRPGPRMPPVDLILGVVERIAVSRPGLNARQFRDAVMADSGCGRPAAQSAIDKGLASGLIMQERVGGQVCVKLATTDRVT